MNITTRALVVGMVCGWVWGACAQAQLPKPRAAVPVVYTTDLFHPHGDPDDHFDLACVFALAKAGFVDLKGIVMDYPPNFRPGDPAMVAVAQMNYLSGLSVPAAIGSSKRAGECPKEEPLAWGDGAGVRLIVDVLRKSEQPVAIVCVGSAASIALAARAEPELFRAKCAGVYLNSGSTHDNEKRTLEFNVKLDPAGYAELFSLPCKLFWFPCWHETEQRASGEDGSFYWLPHRVVLEGVKPGLANYFAYMFGKSSEPKWLRAMKQMPEGEGWQKVLGERRGMWSTASLFAVAGLTVSQDGKILDAAQGVDVPLAFEMTSAEVSCAQDGRTTWKRSQGGTRVELLQVPRPGVYPAAMGAAVAELFKVFE